MHEPNIFGNGLCKLSSNTFIMSYSTPFNVSGGSLGSSCAAARSCYRDPNLGMSIKDHIVQNIILFSDQRLHMC